MHRHGARSRLRIGAVGAVLVAVCAALIGTTPAGASVPSDLIASRSNRALVLSAAAVPAPTGVTPSQGAAAGGTRVSIAGTGLAAVTSVRFGTKAAGIVSRSDTAVVVTAPAIAATTVTPFTTVDVVVAYVGGTATLAAAYTAILPPTVTALSPSSGPVTGNTAVTVYGTRLDYVTKVTFGGAEGVIDTASQTATELTVTTPPGFAGGATVVVASSGGAVSRVRGFVFTSTASQPTDADFVAGHQWDLNGTYGVNAPAAWVRTYGSSSVTVAVVDTGVTDHSDTGLTAAGYDFVTDTVVANDGDAREGDPSDPGDGAVGGADSSWQGTAVGGIVNAAPNELDTIGIAPGVKVQHLRVLGVGGSATAAAQDVADAILWAAGGTVTGMTFKNPTPAKVIALGYDVSSGCTDAVRLAIAAANARGATVVAGAGDAGSHLSATLPANCSAAVIVAATDGTGDLWSSSNHGAFVDVAAPGVGIYALSNSGATVPDVPVVTAVSGTAYAAAHVAGVLALLLSRNRALTATQVQALVKTPAKNTPFRAGNCDLDGVGLTCGAGIINAGLLVP